MAGSSLLTLIDDIASILDDVAAMSKIAAKKTTGVLGDDLALNAQQVAGVNADRELPVVWAVAIGSLRNKLILVPAALAISALIPWAVTPLLMAGGLFLCYEGVEKLAHKLMHGRKGDDAHSVDVGVAIAADQAALEKDKIQGAIRTDFILSAEIIVITLGTVATAPFGKQLAVLTAIALLMTIGVYGLVAGIVKLDDGGLYLSQKNGDSLWRNFQCGMGKAVLKAAPYLMKGLSIAGTAAMFMVGGGILVHGIPGAHDQIHTLAHGAGMMKNVLPLLLDVLVGIVAGASALAGLNLARRFLSRFSGAPR